jgi:tRNA-splicing ligase RtcB
MSAEATLHEWVCDTLPVDVRRALERLRASDDVVAVAVMPDVHLAHEVCVGTAIATRRLLYPDAVGGDIGCGMAAIRLVGGTPVVDRRTAGRILGGLADLVPVMKHRSTPAPDDALWSRTLSASRLERLRDRDGLFQLGTLGRGNHFLELQRDEAGDPWLMVHTGSRALGQAIRAHHLRGCARSRTGLGCLDADTPRGRAYLADVGWALGYADANRRRIVAAAAEVIETVTGARVDSASYFSCHHNHVIAEDDGSLLVHRKGAIPAHDGEPGIIPGSMGDPSFHVRGRGVPEALWSSSHGAGRAMSRADARRRISVGELERRTEGVWFDRRCAARLVDEAPSAYKDITKVMRAQRELTRIVRRLVPVLSYKGA